MGAYPDVIAQIKACMAAGIHLNSCDDDGYCNACGYQERIRTVRCPVDDNDPGPTGPIKGCGQVVEAVVDWEGFVDCDNCGLFFDPNHPNSQPQPEQTTP